MIETLHSLFFTPMGETYFQKALIGGCAIAVVSGVLGCLIILRRMSFLGDALSHAMIAGVAGGYLFMKLVFGVEAHAPGMLFGSLIAAVVTVALIAFVSRVSRIKDDAAIGIMYVGIFALGVMLVSIFRQHIHIDLMHFIMGDILGVADEDLWVAVIVSALVLSVIILLYRYFQISSFDPIMAASIGISVLLIHYVLTVCVALVVVSAVSMVGVILVIGLLITPAATAYLISDRLDKMMILAGIFGLTSVIGGLYISVWIDSSGGAAVMIFSTIQFIVVLFVAPRYGILSDWIRQKRMIPQELLEDILGVLIRIDKQTVETETISQYVKHETGLMNKALRIMESDGLLSSDNSGVWLTDAGKLEAHKILRAHRIWETYLHSKGVPQDSLHEKAHVLEHLHEDESVDYLDHILGHPQSDPHGAEIPDDIIHVVRGENIPVSLMSDGTIGTIQEIKKPALRINLSVGDLIAFGSRKRNGNIWLIYKSDGNEIQLNHSQADSIIVSLKTN